VFRFTSPNNILTLQITKPTRISDFPPSLASQHEETDSVCVCVTCNCTQVSPLSYPTDSKPEIKQVRERMIARYFFSSSQQRGKPVCLATTACYRLVRRSDGARSGPDQNPALGICVATVYFSLARALARDLQDFLAALRPVAAGPLKGDFGEKRESWTRRDRWC
jgi:hypothetical protein